MDDMDDMEEDQEAVEIMKSSQYSNNASNSYMLHNKGSGSKQSQLQQSSLGSSPQPRRNMNHHQASNQRMMDQ